MDQKIFVKEQAEPTRSNTTALAILAGALLLIGLGGIIYLLSNGEKPATSPSPTTKPTVSASTTNTASPASSIKPTTTPATTTTPTATANPVDGTYTAPTDSTKMNVYFPKTPETDQNPNQLMPVLRDKPATKIETETLNTIFSGLTATEKTAGFKTTWSFAGSSTCGGGSYKYSISGKTLKLELCKEFTGSNASLFISAVYHSLVEQGRVNKVAVVTTAGDCLGLPTGDKSCL